MAARVVASPIYRNDASSTLVVSLADFQRLWSSAETARLAADLLGKTWSTWLGWEAGTRRM